MQLDPSKKFSREIEDLDGEELEILVAAIYSHLGYTVFRNIELLVENNQAGEIDVFTTLATPLHEIRLAIECKGSTPSFNDLRKFSSLSKLLNPEPLELIAYGSNNLRTEHNTFAGKLGIRLLKKDDLRKLLLPILEDSGTVSQARIESINRNLLVYTVENFLRNKVYSDIKENEVSTMVRDYSRFLHCELWSIEDPIKQLHKSFTESRNKFNNFSKRVANNLKKDISKELKEPKSPTLQLAMFLELKHRILNIFSIVRCAVHIKSKQGNDILNEMDHPTLKSIINQISDDNLALSKLIPFFFRWIYVWGGIILTNRENKEYEYNLLANEIGVSREVIDRFFKIIETTYSSGNSLIYRDRNKLFFKFVPCYFRAIGLIHRRNYGFTPESSLFHEDSSNLQMLNTALEKYGGLSNIKF